MLRCHYFASAVVAVAISLTLVTGCPVVGPGGSGRQILTLHLGDGETMELVQIPAGFFMMGTDRTDVSWLEKSRPVHSVTISKQVYIGRYEVTQAQWQAVMGTNPSSFGDCDSCPVENISWADAVAFNEALSAMTGYGIRLPTEAEWEYVCRAGTTTAYSFGDSATNLGDYAWQRDNSGSQTHEVGGKLPNPWGLYDMHGNVWEWCEDLYDPEYYSVSPSIDPGGPPLGTPNVARGGSYGDNGVFLFSAVRNWHLPHDIFRSGFGFRVVAGT